MNHMLIGTLLGVVVTIASYGAALFLGWITPIDINLLEAFAVVTSYACTYMFVRETRWAYPIGVLTTLLYSILFFQSGLFAVAAFNLYLVFSLMYGYWRWGPDGKPITVTRVEPMWWSGYITLGFMIWGLILACDMLLGGSTTIVEVVVTVLSGVAQFLLDNKKIETWVVWIAVNVFSIYLYFQWGLFIVAFQYIFFLGNAFYGLYMWHKSMKGSVNESWVSSRNVPAST